MELGLEGKTIIVTGGDSNIGRAITLAFAKEKSNVVIASLDQEQGQKVVKEAEAQGGKAVAIKTDVTDHGSVEAMVKRTLEMFGNIDALVNNAGWVANKLFMEEPREEYETEIKINYLGVINCTRAVLDHMIERKDGRIVNISSDAGRMGQSRGAVYSGTKAAAIAFGKSIAREVGRFGITVNTICPGLTVPEKPGTVSKTSQWAGVTLDMIPPEMKEKAISQYPMGRLGKPEEVANAVVFLASDAANFITGQTLSVSGGFSMM